MESVTVADETLGERGRLIRLKGVWMAECGECEDWVEHRSAHLRGTMLGLLDDLLDHIESAHQVRR